MAPGGGGGYQPSGRFGGLDPADIPEMDVQAAMAVSITIHQEVSYPEVEEFHPPDTYICTRKYILAPTVCMVRK